VDLWFNFRNYYSLEIDLNHINLGKKKTREEFFTILKVQEIIQYFLDEIILEASRIREYKTGSCQYFSLISVYQKKNYKLVFCICSDRPITIGIITLFRIGGKNESL
jgi:hypothetical protein